MEMKMDNEVIVDISGAHCKHSVSSNHPENAYDPIVTTSQSLSQQHTEEVTDLMAKSSSIELAIPSGSQTENIHQVSATAASASELLETPNDSSPVTPRTPSMASPGEGNDDGANGHSPTRKRLNKVLAVICKSLSLCFTLLFILSVTMNELKDKEIWSLELWRACCFGGLFFGAPFISNIIFFLMEKRFSQVKRWNQERLRQYVTGLILIYSSNIVLDNRGVLRSTDISKNIDFFNCIYCICFVLSTLTLGGTLIDRLHIKTFSKRILENRINQYILQTLSGLPFREISEVHSSRLASCSRSKVIDMQMSQMIKDIKRTMIEKASQTGFYTLPKALNKSKDSMDPDEQNNRIITTEREAKAAGDLIFKNVAKLGYKYIDEEDLLRFMTKEELDIVLPMIVGKEESGRINEKSFIKWVVSMYMKSEFLNHSSNDIKEATRKLHILLEVILVVVFIIAAEATESTTQVLIFIITQILLTVFTFVNISKSTFEAMILVFLKHPFDVGDHCIIDGVQVVVEKVSIMTTVFMRYDNEKIYYPNSILATKSISNFNRSPEMRDIVDFDLDVSALEENISAIKAKIRAYIDSNHHLWQPKHSVWVRESGDVKMKMRLCLTNTINFQDYEEISDRRSNLVRELTNIFHQLKIKYHIYPPTSSD